MNALSKLALMGCLVGLSACLSGTSQPQRTGEKKCTIYLTFDDGPLNGSENIDSVILAEKIKISVFLVGAHVEANRRMDTYFKYYEENPYIDEYNHSYSHANNHYEKFYSDPQSAIADILKNQQLLKLHYKIVRLPGRNMWRLNGKKRDDGVSGASTADGLAAQGYKVIGWDLEWQHHPDGRPVQTVDAMFDEIAQRCKTGNAFTKGNIVLLIHDEMFQTKWEESALKQLVDRLKASGAYSFEQIRFYPQ
ncbi:polysaccharide deacetylase family protein [Niabella pedocola]|uniref:Polysaccharide deacetylase family protein n=1 Tax=Niabella pedocola TaxID=1752077 RepID=A0ABS8PUW3_9BACT|nr:polysaccharide deacetylase family protein [Niabella pedocola]MCD2423696.1 polysaccharide deacetylase family protein [Niabella pedocola]